MNCRLNCSCGRQVSDLTGSFRLYRKSIIETLMKQVTSKVSSNLQLRIQMACSLTQHLECAHTCLPHARTVERWQQF